MMKKTKRTEMVLCYGEKIQMTIVIITEVKKYTLI